MSNFAIGTAAGGAGAIKDLCLYAAEDPEATYQEYSEVVGQDLNGANIEAGLPRASWRWAQLSQAEFDALLDFTGGAASAPVYIRTRVNTGALLSEWGTFLAVMQRPVSTPAGQIVHNDVAIDFVAMVAV